MASLRKFGKIGRIGAMIGLTVAYFIVEIVVGHITSSIALVADSFHMLSDVVALVVGLAAVRISKMNSEKSTFGWVRAEVLGALVNTVFLLALCFSIFVDSVQRIFKKEQVDNPKLLLIVGSVGLGINLLGLLIFHDHAHGHSHGGGGHSHGSKERKSLLEPDSGLTEEAEAGPSLPQQLQQPGKSVAVVIQKEDVDGGAESHGTCGASCGEDHSGDSSSNSASYRQLNGDQPTGDLMPAAAASGSRDAKKHRKHSHGKKGQKSTEQLNMRGIFLHVLGDALGSVVVIISALLIWLVPNPEGEGHIDWKPYIDPVLSLVLVAIIVATTVPLLKESALILLQAVPTQLSIQEMNEALEKMDGVLAVHELHVWQLAGSRHVASLHLTVVSLEDYIRLSSRIKNYFHDNGVHSVTIQPEFDELHVKKEGRDCALECGPEKSCYTDTCCGKKLTSSASATPQQLLQLIEAAAATEQQQQGGQPATVPSPADRAGSLDGLVATGEGGGEATAAAPVRAQEEKHHQCQHHQD